MSFDIFLERFEIGAPVEDEVDAARSLLIGLISGQGDGLARLCTADGDACVYGLDPIELRLMFNHVSGRATWDLIFFVARACRLAIVPIGCGTLVTDVADLGRLPDEAPTPIVVAHCGQDLLDAVEAPGAA